MKELTRDEALKELALATAHYDGRHRVHRAWHVLAEAVQVLETPARATSNLVPGAMYCAKCNFGLQRNNLNANDGTVSAGSSETEPCPNGCGPLWPVTWEHEARECWKRMEEMFLAAPAQLRVDDAMVTRACAVTENAGNDFMLSLPKSCKTVPLDDLHRAVIRAALEAALRPAT